MIEFSLPHKRFLAQNIESISKLEVLLFLHASGKREWSADGVNAALRGSLIATENQLKDLAEKNILKTKPALPTLYRFEPDNTETARLVDEIAQIYKEYRTSVIEWLYSTPDANIQKFADAFKIRKDK